MSSDIDVIMSASEKDLAKHHERPDDAESDRASISPQASLKRQLKNRHIAMIR